MSNREKLLCYQANQIDLVDFLASAGHAPKKILGNDFWYLSPLRKEQTASFKVNRKLNLWYDHGTGKGGTLVDFGIIYFSCTVKELLVKLKDNQKLSLSFQPQLSSSANEKKKSENIDKIKIIRSKKIDNPGVVNYLHQRKIPASIANKFCHEICFELHDKTQIAIGFKNDRVAMNYTVKILKEVVRLRAKINHEDGAKGILVFEGFFDFLSFQKLLKSSQGSKAELPTIQSDFLILNSISFFEKQRQTMEYYSNIHLFLDRDKMGMELTKLALQWLDKYQDQSQTYKRFKDLMNS